VKKYLAVLKRLTK